MFRSPADIVPQSRQPQGARFKAVQREPANCLCPSWPQQSSDVKSRNARDRFPNWPKIERSSNGLAGTHTKDLTPTKSPLTPGAPLTALESALTKTQLYKSRRISTYRKKGALLLPSRDSRPLRGPAPRTCTRAYLTRPRAARIVTPSSQSSRRCRTTRRTSLRRLK
jgi:hypothetical protein